MAKSPTGPQPQTATTSPFRIEQFSAADSTHAVGTSGVGGLEAAQFGVEGLQHSLAASHAAGTSADPVARLFDDVIKHAGGPNLADDATAVLITW